jgi:osmotically-inducible protein OsmY
VSLKIISVDRQQKKDFKMKTYSKLFILSAVFLGITSIAGCDKLKESTEPSTSSNAAKMEFSDSEVTTKVKTALLTDLKAKSFDISVVTLKGDVRLSGTVDNQTQLDHIDKLVRSIEGVHSIHDELTIKK